MISYEFDIVERDTAFLLPFVRKCLFLIHTYAQTTPDQHDSSMEDIKSQKI